MRGAECGVWGVPTRKMRESTLTVNIYEHCKVMQPHDECEAGDTCICLASIM